MSSKLMHIHLGVYCKGMLLHVRFCFKIFSTKIARKRAKLVVYHFFVSLQAIPKSERKVTLIAFEWSHSFMNAANLKIQ